MFLNDWLSAKPSHFSSHMTKGQTSHNCQWILWPFDSLKCNIDTLVNADDKLSTFGVIIRDGDSLLVLGFSCTLQDIC